MQAVQRNQAASVILSPVESKHRAESGLRARLPRDKSSSPSMHDPAKNKKRREQPRPARTPSAARDAATPMAVIASG